jgi:hypothetical protein
MTYTVRSIVWIVVYLLFILRPLFVLLAQLSQLGEKIE